MRRGYKRKRILPFECRLNGCPYSFLYWACEYSIILFHEYSTTHNNYQSTTNGGY